MKNVLRNRRARRAVTLTILIAIAVPVATGAATAAYSGMTKSGEILSCFTRSDGTVRVVDHYPCHKGEEPLRWNSRGVAGADGRTGDPGRDGADGSAGATGSAGDAGQNGAAGAIGSDGASGAKGVAGEQGPAGADGAPGEQGPAGDDGAPGRDGATGPTGPQGAQGPAGPSGRGSGMQFGQATNNTDPDCAMIAPVGRGTAAGCNFTSVHAVGEYLPSSLIISGFRVLLDRTVNSPVDVVARAIAPDGSSSVDAFVLCSVPAGSNTCGQTGERTLTGPNLFMLQLGGDRSWTKARFGYSMVQA